MAREVPEVRYKLINEDTFHLMKHSASCLLIW